MKTVKINKIKEPIRLSLTNYNRGSKYMTNKTLSDSLLFGKQLSEHKHSHKIQKEITLTYKANLLSRK